MNNSNVYTKMFFYLFIGLLISFLTGYVLSTNVTLLYSVLSIGIFPIIIIEFALAIIMSLLISKMHPVLLFICYIIYCITTGLTLSTIFIIYNMSSIISILAICAVIFALLAIYGMFTKQDLSHFGTILLIGLFGLIVGELLNTFIFKSTQTEVIISAIGVAIFVGYIAYDVNRVKKMLPYYGENKTAIYGAFQLYLDFINMFLRLLNLFGKRND